MQENELALNRKIVRQYTISLETYKILINRVELGDAVMVGRLKVLIEKQARALKKMNAARDAGLWQEGLAVEEVLLDIEID